MSASVEAAHETPEVLLASTPWSLDALCPKSGHAAGGSVHSAPPAQVVALSKLTAVHRMSTPTRHRNTHSSSSAAAMYASRKETTPALPPVVDLHVPRSVRSVSYTFSSQLNTDDDDTTLDRDSSKYAGMDDEEYSHRSAQRTCGLADSFCGFGYDATQSRQVPLSERPPKYERRMQELRDRNQQLHYQNQSLHQENAQMTQTIRLTSTTSDQTVLTLQQRCQTAEYKNIQLEKEIALLKLQVGTDGVAPDVMRNFASTDEATMALLNQRDDTIAELRQQCLQLSQQMTCLQELAHGDSNSAATQQDLLRYQKHILDLETANHQLEVEVREAVDHVEHKTEYYNDTIREMEDKYGQMERQVLESKLLLAAANEVQEQLVEEHQLAIQSLQEENDELLNDVMNVKKDRDILSEEKEQLIQELKRSVAAAYEEKELLLAEHQSTIQTMDESKLLLIQELTVLKQERAQLFDLKKEDEKKTDFECGIDSQLHVELQQSRETIEQLRRELAQIESVSHDRGLIGNNDEPQSNTDELLQVKVDELTTKVKKLKKGLLVAKNENSRIRAQSILKSKNLAQVQSDPSMDTDETVDVDDESTMSETSTRRLLKERDDAISSLVKQAVGQDKLIAELRSEIDILNSKVSEKADRDISSDVETVQQLQQEAEVFASQVIELDAEIELLKSTVISHEHHVAELENQLKDARARLSQQLSLREKDSLTAKIHDLEAEIDELKEANMTQQDELRNLRRKLWNAASADEEISKSRNEVLVAKREVANHLETIEVICKEKDMLNNELLAERGSKAELERQLRDEILSLQKTSLERISSLEEKLDESRWLYDELKASPGHMSEEAVIVLRDELEILRQNHTSQTEELRIAKSTIKELEEILADQNANCAANFEEEKEELLAEIESLTHRLNDAHDRIAELEADSGLIADFKDKLERADLAREESEKSIVDTFDRRISLLTLDKDVTIDKLRKELMIEKQTKTEEMEEVVAQLKDYQVEISELREEMAEQIEHREARIFALEATLTAQEQLVTTMKTEMDHLQSSMEGSVARRKEENDEMQQELLTLTAAAGKQEREITSLKLELEAKTLEYQSIIAKLEHKVAVLEKTPSELRNAQDLQMELRVKEVKDRLEKLKWRNTSLKEENLNLRERLEQMELLVKANGDSDCIKELEEQLSKQILKVKTLETALQSTREPPVDHPEVASTVSVPEAISDATSVASTAVDSKVPATPPRPKKSLTRSASPMATIDSKERKVSAPSPPRRGLKLFGRK